MRCWDKKSLPQKLDLVEEEEEEEEKLFVQFTFSKTLIGSDMFQ